MKKVYLSGPISGLPLDVARDHFAQCANFVHKHYPEAEVFNPMEFTTYDESKRWQDYMHECLAVLEQCDAIVLLPKYWMSNGAQCERFYARGLGIEEWHYSPKLSSLESLDPEKFRL